MKYISIFFICISLVYSQDKSGSKVFLNGGLNYNMHTTNIKGFEGFENCCDEFTGGNSLAPIFGIGYELGIGSIVGNLPSSYVLQLNYNNIGSKYSEERFRGYKINEFDKEEIIVEHQLNPNISIISIGNSVYTDLFDNFSFGLGFDLGFVASSSFTQTELAKSPDSFLFSNGQREINTSEGSIEEMHSFLFSVFGGVRYNIYSFDNWDIRPEVKFNYFPSSILEGKNLNVSQLTGSISFVYNFVDQVEPPPTPPMPKELTPPDTIDTPPPPTINVQLTIKDKAGNNISDNQIIDLPITVYETKQEYALKPVVFFDSSASEYKQYNIESFTNTDYDVQSQMLSAVAEKMKSQNLSVNLTTYDLQDEGTTLANSRLELITQKLVEYGVDKNKIKTNIVRLDKEFKYNELKQEYRRVELNLSDNSDLIKSVYEINNRIEYEDLSFYPESKVDASRDDYSQEMELYINEEEIRTKESDFNFSINKDYYNEFNANNTVKVIYSSSAQVVGIYDSDRISFQIKPKVIKINQTINTLEGLFSQSEQHILGYTEFDKANFTSVDSKVLSLVKEAISKGKKVSIYASTDNLGDAEYNRTLAEKRAKSAISLIGGNDNNIQVIYPEEYLFSNEHPYGRMLNRAIVVRIDQ